MADREQGGESVRTVRVEGVSRSAPIWLIGWLFTIGFAGLDFVPGLFALLIWPYYLGVALAGA